MAAAQDMGWVILDAIPKVAAEEEESIFPRFTNMSFTFGEPPHAASYQTIADYASPCKAPCYYSYIAAVDRSGVLLLCGYQASGLSYYLCEPRSRLTRYIEPPEGINYRRCVGLIRGAMGGSDGLIRGAMDGIGGSDGIMVVELKPRLITKPPGRVTILCTVDRFHWVEKELAYSYSFPDGMGWRGDGFLSHEGMLWWFDLSYCILNCDPFADTPELHRVLFPHVPDALRPTPHALDGDGHRCLKLSEGRLRYAQFHGTRDAPVVSMWTLSSNNPATALWTLDHSVPLVDIWNDESYKATTLPPRVPVVALVHPMNADEVYFFLDRRILCVNLLVRRVLECGEFPAPEPPYKIRSSRMVHCWQLPLELTRIDLCFQEPWSTVDEFQKKAMAARIRSRLELHDKSNLRNRERLARERLGLKFSE